MTWLQVGSSIDDRYVVEDLLGEGGMGVVLSARHRVTGGRVAIKMLHPHLRMRSDLTARFLAEARAPAAIGHPGIVRVLDAGTTPSGDPYFAMELLDGEPLAALIRRGPMPFESIRRISIEILEALAAAHAAGFIHRDLKPENVFIERTGRVKLLDFGIAKSLGEIDAGSATATGATMGTLFYMSPEQLRNAKRVDHRTDLWAVGVMLYLMLTGTLPFRAESLGDMLMTVLSAPLPPLEAALFGVPPSLEDVVRRALAVDPAQRFSSANEMATALIGLPSVTLQPRSTDGFVAMPMTAIPATVGTSSLGPTLTEPRRESGRRVWIAVAVVLSLLLVLGLGLGVAAISGVFLWSKQKIDALEPGCRVGCQVALGCGLPGRADECTTECQTDEKLAACYGTAGADCDRIGACKIERLCNLKPTGTLSCNQAQDCERSCGLGDIGCACRCLGQTDPNKASEIIVRDMCVLHYCTDDCIGESASASECSRCTDLRCQKEVSACRAN